MNGNIPLGVGPHVDIITLGLDPDAIGDDTVSVTAEWRTEPRRHMWVTDAVRTSGKTCTICGEPVTMAVDLTGEGTPADAVFWHQDGSLHLEPSEALIRRRLTEMGL